MAPFYDFRPRATPAPGHGWFRYAQSSFPCAEGDFARALGEGRLLHGATISGVAMQVALLMGASEIHLYGCSMDNDAGDNYLHAGSRGRTTPSQRASLANLLDVIRGSGTRVLVHGGASLSP